MVFKHIYFKTYIIGVYVVKEKVTVGGVYMIPVRVHPGTTRVHPGAHL